MGKLTRTVKVTYPGHLFEPNICLYFVETSSFQKSWKEIGFTDEDYFALQVAIQAHPKGPKVIKGTGGLRKVRFTPSGASGNRKAVRVCYVYFPDYAFVLLVLAYPKNELDNLTDAQIKAIRSLIERQKDNLGKRFSR